MEDMGMGDEVQAALAKIVLVGAQQVLAPQPRALPGPALPAMEARLAGLKKIDDRGETELHAPKRRYRELLHRGVRHELARNTASSGKGAWPLSATKALTFALPNTFFDSLGLYRPFV